MASRPLRTLVSVASLSLLGACATSRTTTTTVTGTPRLEPTPVAATPAPAPAPTPAPAAGAFDPSGRWNLVFDLGGQALEVVMELVKVPAGGYGGTLSSQMGNVPILSAKLDGTKMEATFTAPDGSTGSMTLTFNGTTVDGTWSASGMGSRVSGARP